MKIGRNAPCPCGSGLKYKKCCIDKKTTRNDKNESKNHSLQDLILDLKKSFGKKMCLHPNSGSECQGSIIKAHTIQRNGGLSAIAKDGLVYSGIADNDVIKTGEMFMKPVGISKASTFTGFCGFHDRTTFLNLEKKPFIGDQEQCFLVMYRALCRELYMKSANIENFGNLLNRAVRANNAILKDMMTGAITGANAAIKELQFYKRIYDQMLIDGNYSSVCYYVVFLDSMPDILCTGGFQPQWDFSGQRIQDLAEMNYLLKHITFSIIASDTGGVIIFTWADENNDSAPSLVRSFDLLSSEEKINASIRLAFEYVENTFASPIWWDSLENDQQDYLQKKLLSGVKTNRNGKELLKNGMKFSACKIRNISTNIDIQI